MVNNRDDQFETQDDSEYHFSDDEVSYEVESENPKPAAAPPEKGGNFISRLGGSRRLIISAAVFLAIVFVVYKIIVPGTSTPSTNITNTSTVATQPQTVTSAQPTVAAAPETQSAVVAQPTEPVTTPTATAQTQPVVEHQTAQTPPAVATMPPVIPVQSSVNATQSPEAAMNAYIQEKSPALNASSEQVMAQMQAHSTQQFNEFTTQTKAMQNQIQSLSARVADMEAQINQLVQVLTKRSQTVTAPVETSITQSQSQVQRAPEVKIAYNVQAIIPGRAWLKSDNGETLTVAEGDVIRNVGRVTKIDPYDGVVEINTGTKAISLSYGNGG